MPDKSLIVSFAVTSTKLKLPRNVQVGMSQLAFETAFKKKTRREYGYGN